MSASLTRAHGPASLQELPQRLEASEGFAGVLEALARRHAATVDGCWNSSAALVAATLGLRAPQTLVVVLAHPRDVDFWAQDLASFGGLHAAVFPAWDALPSADTVVDEIGGQ